MVAMSASQSASRIAFAAMLALAVAMGIGRFAFTPLLPMMQESDGLTLAEGGWLATANYMGYLAGALGAMAVTVERSMAIRGGLFAIGLVTLGMGLTHEYAIWLALRAAAGIASAWVMIYLSAWALERLAALNQPFLSGRIYAGVGLGIMAAGIASLVLMHFAWSAAAAWLLLGLVSLAVALLSAPVFRSRSTSAAASASASGSVRFVWQRDALCLVFAFAASGFGYIISATFLPAMARDLVRDPAVFGWAWPVFGAAALLSTLAVSALRGRLPLRHAWIASQLLMAAGIVLSAVWHDIAATIASGLIVGGTFMVITMAALQEARALAGARAVGLLSAMTAAFALGQLLGPLSVNLILARGGSLSTALILAAAVLVAGACVLVYKPAPAQTAKSLET